MSASPLKDTQGLTTRTLVLLGVGRPPGRAVDAEVGQGKWIWAQVATSPPRTPLFPGEHEKRELRVLGTHCYVGHTTNPLKVSCGEKEKNNPQDYFCLCSSSDWVFLPELFK